MEPSGVGGMGQQLEEGCTGSVASLGARSSYLSLMASVAPQYGLVQHSSLATWYNNDCSVNQLAHIPPSVDSVVEEQPFPPNCSRSYKQMAFPCLGNESDTGPGNQPMQHFQQQIACGFGSMEPSGFGGIEEHLQEQEECTGSVLWFGASSSCLDFMASVAPQDGLTQHSCICPHRPYHQLQARQRLNFTTTLPPPFDLREAIMLGY
ncbi:uncharacterized protein [Miscanthus floridulus]